MWSLDVGSSLKKILTFICVCSEVSHLCPFERLNWLWLTTVNRQFYLAFDTVYAFPYDFTYITLVILIKFYEIKLCVDRDL